MLYFHFCDTPTPNTGRIPVSEDKLEQVKRERAFHITPLAVSELAPENWENVKYRGDWWFDVDEPNLEKAITSLHGLMDALEKLDVNLEHLRYFASGSKGFHVRVPASLFDGDREQKHLPKIYKQMALRLVFDHQVKGLDMNLYNGKTGHLLRVENKPRPDGKFKVPLTLAEARAITVEQYSRLTKHPREIPIPLVPKGSSAEALRILYEQCRGTATLIAAQHRHRQTRPEHLEPLKGRTPGCIEWLLSESAPVKRALEWNAKAMQIVAYVLHTNPPDVPGLYVRAAAAHTGGTRHKSTESRVSNLTYLEKAINPDEFKFSCGAMRALFTRSPCTGCPVNSAQISSNGQGHIIEETLNGYVRDDVIITYCTFELKKVFQRTTQTSYNSHEGDQLVVMKSGQPVGEFTVTPAMWADVRTFVTRLLQVSGEEFFGNARDLLHIHRLIQSKAEAKLESILSINVTKLGIQQAREPDGSVSWYYCEGAWSLGPSAITDYVVYDEPPNMAFHRVRPIRDVIPVSGTDNPAPLATLLAMLRTNAPHVVGVMMGWMSACVLKPMLPAMGGLLTEFPLLALIGATGGGKSQTAVLWSALAGSNNVDHGTIHAPKLTPYVLDRLASEYTSIPVVLDELNERFMSHRTAKYTLDVLKQAYCSETGGKGFVDKGNNTLSMRDMRATSPIVWATTEPPEELEIKNRTIELVFTGKLAAEHRAAFRDLTTYQPERYNHLEAIYAAMVRYAVREMTPDSMANLIRNSQTELPQYIVEEGSRLLANWRVVLIGLNFCHTVLIHAGFTPAQLALIVQIKRELIQHLADNEDVILSRKREDAKGQFLSALACMATLNTHDPCRIVAGFHYYRQGDTLSLRLSLIIDIYSQYCKRAIRIPAYKTTSGLLQEIKNTDMYVGYTPLPDVSEEIMFLHLDTRHIHGVELEPFAMISPGYQL